MEHPFDAGGGSRHGASFGDVASDDRQVRIPVIMLKVGAAANDKGVERAHGAALRQQAA
jgi:hypothetical protein